MNRRDFARTVVGAIVGTSAIPAFGEKPEFPKLIAALDPAISKGGDQCSITYMVKDSVDAPFRVVRTEPYPINARAWAYPPVKIEGVGFKMTTKKLPLDQEWKPLLSDVSFMNDIPVATKLHLKEQWGS